MPVAEIFYGMANKGFNGQDVLREINQKLKRILPTGMFCCGAMIEADFKLNQLQIWNGGLPDGWLIRTTGELLALPSRHLPLGILAPDQFNADFERVGAAPGDRVLMMTDGFLESADSAGNVFGEQGVTGTLDRLDDGDHPFDAMMSAVHRFTGNFEDGDDLTLCCLEMMDEAGLATLPDRAAPSALAGPAEWRCSYEIRERTLGEFSPLPLLLHICMEVPGLRRKSGEIYTLLAELYNNALEHGVLELPSEWKHSPEGFGRYYAERNRRLANVEGHYIRFTLHHSLNPDGGRLRVICEDSGQGFDFHNHPSVAPGNSPTMSGRYAGRGLLLLKRLAETIRFHEQGNHVEIVYDWQFARTAENRDD
jgi:anti-sigma regulatory factor (Ser/Thr protein kinase)